MVVLMPPPVSSETSECSDCKRNLLPEEYYWSNRGYRHNRACKACYQIKRRAYQINYMATIGRAKANARYCPEKRSQSIVKSYGLTLEKYDQILAAQKGGCAICHSKTAKTKRNGRFCVDHDHVTEQVRGLLCAACNRGIGLLQDNAEILDAGAAYLRSRKAWNC